MSLEAAIAELTAAVKECSTVAHASLAEAAQKAQPGKSSSTPAPEEKEDDTTAADEAEAKKAAAAKKKAAAEKDAEANDDDSGDSAAEAEVVTSITEVKLRELAKEFMSPDDDDDGRAPRPRVRPDVRLRPRRFRRPGDHGRWLRFRHRRRNDRASSPEHRLDSRTARQAGGRVPREPRSLASRQLRNFGRGDHRQGPHHHRRPQVRRGRPGVPGQERTVDDLRPRVLGQRGAA